MNQLEEKRYERLGEHVQKEIVDAQKKILELKEDLIKAQEVRQHRQEYDAMATVIQKHPDRATSEADITLLQGNLKKVKDRIMELTEQLELRHKQSSVLVLAIQQLLDSLDNNTDSEIPMET